MKYIHKNNMLFLGAGIQYEIKMIRLCRKMYGMSWGGGGGGVGGGIFRIESSNNK